jgi:hypothetical protein
VGYKNIFWTRKNYFSQRGRDEVRIWWYQGFTDKIKALLISKGVVAEQTYLGISIWGNNLMERNGKLRTQ